jgi:LPXTG-motif cell wall-anchored protein
MKKINKRSYVLLIITVLLVVMIGVPITSRAAIQSTVNLGSTSGFAILAGSTITNTGTTTINGSAGGTVGGDIGLYPGTVFTGASNIVTANGSIHLADTIAMAAKDDLVTAYNDAAGRTPVTRIPTELGGSTLTPGTYESADGTFQITGILTLDAQNDPEAVFIFKTASTLITASGSSVNLINSARFCRTFWQVGSSATLGTNSVFVGHILAFASITANTGAAVQGQLLARNGAVTLDSNIITNGICETSPTTTGSAVTTGSAILHVIKHVINDNGSTASAANFNIHIKASGNDVVASPAQGVEAPGNTYVLAAGNYVVSEDASADYILSYSGDSDSIGNITLVPGDNKTVIMTNNDITPIPAVLPATLHVIKHVVNDNGGKSIAANFTLHIKTSGNDIVASPAQGVEAPGNTYVLAAGNYVVSEDASADYILSYSGDSDSIGNITLAPGDNKTVIMTNNDITPIPAVLPATLHVIKHVVNDNGRKSKAANFKLHVKSLGIDVVKSPAIGTEAPGTTYTLKAGTYVVSEDASAGYILSYSGDSNSIGKITLASGDNKTVTIINNDIAPIVINKQVIKSTVVGGQLPKTSSNLYQLLIIGAAFMLLGVLGLTNRKRFE